MLFDLRVLEPLIIVGGQMLLRSKKNVPSQFLFGVMIVVFFGGVASICAKKAYAQFTITIKVNCNSECDGGCASYSGGLHCPSANIDLSPTCENKNACAGCGCWDNDPGFGTDCNCMRSQ